MDQSVAAEFVALLWEAELPPGLSVTHAEVVGLPDDPIVVVQFADTKRKPRGTQAAWWDFRREWPEFEDRPQDLATHTKLFLEELFSSGAPYEDRPRDHLGVTWAEMDSWTGTNRLPPFLRADTAKSSGS